MPNRYVCSVLAEIRELDKTKRYDRLIGMVEEVQTLVNRMECKLADRREKAWSTKEKIQKLKQQVKKLKGAKKDDN